MILLFFYQVDFFDITNFEILNTFGQIVKFELITAYEKWISRNTSDYKV